MNVDGDGDDDEQPSIRPDDAHTRRRAAEARTRRGAGSMRASAASTPFERPANDVSAAKIAAN